MARVTKDCERGSWSDLLPGAKGELFAHPDGYLWDSQDVFVVHNGLDTVRQLYNGLINAEVYARIEAAYDSGFGEVVRVGIFDFVVSSGGKSGYRYTLKNQNAGLVVLVGSSYCDTCYNGAHLKIQCSPIFLLCRSIRDIQADLDDLAADFLFQVVPSGVAVHICADIQGWSAPADLDLRMVTKARRIVRHSGQQGLDYDLNGLSVVYGKSQSFTFGSQSGLQFACYNKGKAVIDKGELPLWMPVWCQHDSFDENASVWRIEARFHHSVVEQFARGSGFQCRELLDLEKHLTGLWRYALQHHRLDASPTYIDPFWQWLRDDVVFYHSAKLDVDYKRLYKSPTDEGLPSDRSVMICFGQMCSIYRKKKLTAEKALNHMVNSGLWDLVCETYAKRGLEPDDVILEFEAKINRKRVVH